MACSMLYPVGMTTCCCHASQQHRRWGVGLPPGAQDRQGSILVASRNGSYLSSMSICSPQGPLLSRQARTRVHSKQQQMAEGSLLPEVEDYRSFARCISSKNRMFSSGKIHKGRYNCYDREEFLSSRTRTGVGCGADARSCRIVGRASQNNIVSGHGISDVNSAGDAFKVGSLTSTVLSVAVDVDEVLGRFVHSLNMFCLEKYGMNYVVEDYHVYDFARVWACSQDESNQKVHEFFKSAHFRDGIEVIPGSFDSLRRLKQQHEIMVVTSRQHVIEQPTIEWLDRHFPDIFDAVHFGNHFALEGSSRKKSEICKEIGAHVLIDDNPWYALECAAAGIHVLLYDWKNGYPWSKTEDGPQHANITRVRDWEEVENALQNLAKEIKPMERAIAQSP